jgi:hypothetical protein
MSAEMGDWREEEESLPEVAADKRQGNFARRALVQAGWAVPTIIAVGSLLPRKAQAQYEGGGGGGGGFPVAVGVFRSDEDIDDAFNAANNFKNAECPDKCTISDLINLESGKTVGFVVFDP